MTVSISLIGQYDSLQRMSDLLQKRISDATAAVGSGQKSDLPVALGADLRPYIDMRNSQELVDARLSLVGVGLSRVQAFTQAVSFVRQGLDATAQALGGGLSNPQQAFYDSASGQGKSSLEAITSALNSQYGARFMFAGDAVQTKPLVNTQSLITMAQQIVADRKVADGGTLTNLDALNTAIDNIFDDTSTDPTQRFSAVYAGGTGFAPPLRISDNETVDYTLRANDQNFRDAMKYAVKTAILSDVRAAVGTSQSGQTTAEQYVNTLYAKTRGAQDNLVTTQAVLGSREKYVTDMQTSLQTTKDAFVTRLQGYDGVDLAQTSTQLNAYKAQLEALYSLIGQMKSLSLVNYLR